MLTLTTVSCNRQRHYRNYWRTSANARAWPIKSQAERQKDWQTDRQRRIHTHTSTDRRNDGERESSGATLIAGVRLVSLHAGYMPYLCDWTNRRIINLPRRFVNICQRSRRCRDCCHCSQRKLRSTSTALCNILSVDGITLH